MNKRLDKFKSFETHDWLGRLYKKLRKEEVEIAVNFLIQNADSSKDVFFFKINRMFLDNSNKPKNFLLIMELLSCAASQ